MSSNIVDLNNNLIIGAEYYIRFFNLDDYELNENDFGMSNWSSALTDNQFSLPIINISSFSNNAHIWYRNEPLFDKMVIELDPSKENNLMEFIARGAEFNNVKLNDLKKLIANVYIRYASTTVANSQLYLMTGRVKLIDNSDKKLTIQLEQMDKILTGSDFEKYVKQDPNGSSYNYVSIKQAFENILNAPHNKIDDYSYPVQPFTITEETYKPSDDYDIIYKDDNLPDNNQIYAEDWILDRNNVSRKTHCQFYYNLNNPSCGYKITEYADEFNGATGQVISENSYEVIDWNVWNNTQDVGSGAIGYEKEVILNYQRYFRPFKIVIAGENETKALNDGNYRIKRNYVYPNYNPNNLWQKDQSLYEPTVNNHIFTQEKILPGDDYTCEEDDVLVYFEQLGDVRFRLEDSGIPSANILYDNYSTVYVYNQTKDIVYFDHVTRFVQSTPLPKKWLEMQTYIHTEKIYFASRLNYESSNNIERAFASYIKPMCAINFTDGSHGSRQFVASINSYKQNQDADGNGGDLFGEKTHLSYVLGTYDLDDSVELEKAKFILDYITENNKPKSIRISNSGDYIFFLKNELSGFSEWDVEGFDDSWDPVVVPQNSSYNLSWFKTQFKWIGKEIYHEDSSGKISVSKKEYNILNYLNFGFAVNSKWPLISELSNGFYGGSLALLDFTYENESNPGDIIGNSRVIKKTSSSVSDSEYNTISFNRQVPVVNFFRTDDNIYWCLGPLIKKGLEETYYFATEGNVVDFWTTNDESIQRAIVTTGEKIIYLDTVNNTTEEESNIIGIDYLLPCDRGQYDLTCIFVDPAEGNSNRLYRLSNVTDEDIRLLSFDGNRYQASNRLAASFFKNTYYDTLGVCNIGSRIKKINLDDNDFTTISIQKFKYDSLEYTPKSISKGGFEQFDNNNATNKEEDDNFFDEDISIDMWTNKDVQLNFTISRLADDIIKWDAINEFGEETGELLETGFNFITVPLTGDFDGIVVYVNFFDTYLKQGEKFRGVINKRKYKDFITPKEIGSSTNTFPFLDNTNLNLNLPFVYEQDSEYFADVLSNYFIYNNEVRELVLMEVELPCLLFVDSNNSSFNAGTIATISSETKYNNGFELIDSVTVEPYNTNKCDYYIETIKYNIKQGTTTLSLVSV